MLKVLGDGGVGSGVKDHDSGDRGGGTKKNPFCTFAHAKKLKVFFFSFFSSCFLSPLSLIFPHSSPRSSSNLSDAAPFS